MQYTFVKCITNRINIIHNNQTATVGCTVNRRKLTAWTLRIFLVLFDNTTVACRWQQGRGVKENLTGSWGLNLTFWVIQNNLKYDMQYLINLLLHQTHFNTSLDFNHTISNWLINKIFTYIWTGTSQKYNRTIWLWTHTIHILSRLVNN